MQWYSASHKDLYITFQKKNMIDNAENIDEPEDYQHTNNMATIPTEILPAGDSSNSSSQPVVENKAEKIAPPESPKTEVIPKESVKKMPPPLPPKPDHLKVVTKTSIPEPKSEPLPESKPESKEPYGVPGPSGTSKPLAEDIPETISEANKVEAESIPKPEQMPKPESETVSEADKIKRDRIALIMQKMDAKKQLTKEEKKELKAFEDGRLEAIVKESIHPSEDPKNSEPKSVPKIEPTIYMDEKLEDLYKKAKAYWEDDGADPEEFDWESFAIEIEDLPNHKSDPIADPYHHHLKRAVQIYRDKSNKGTSNMYTYPPNNVLAQKIRKYYTEERGTVRIPLPKGCKIIPVKKIVPMVPNINEKELAEANGIEECSDDDEDGELDEMWSIQWNK